MPAREVNVSPAAHRHVRYITTPSPAQPSATVIAIPLSAAEKKKRKQARKKVAKAAERAAKAADEEAFLELLAAWRRVRARPGHQLRRVEQE